MKDLTATKLYALAFGCFLGLCIWKFGNPVILDHKITAPDSASEWLNDPWPLRWANWIFLLLVLAGTVLVFCGKISWPQSKWLWWLPLIWLGWQFVSATRTVDADLTTATLWQFSGCVAGYFLGALLFHSRVVQQFLFIGIIAAFTFCLIRAVDQRLFEYPLSRQLLLEAEHTGWNNFPPATIAEMKRDNFIITTNGVDVVNPIILEKLKNNRVSGTLVYPNALAGIILLLWPAALAFVLCSTQKLKPSIRLAAAAVVAFLGGLAFFWSGSKLAWLVAMGIAGLYLLRRDWPRKLKFLAVAAVLILGLGIFAVRFQHYFAAGATSASARLDYWRAAVQTCVANPIFGTGSGTFQRPYAQIKSPESEMARLTHNDYLEQFSDSGIVGGLAYTAWIVFAILWIGKKLQREGGGFQLALVAGLLGWFAQGLGEFGLYIPATAWIAFVLLGGLVGAGGLMPEARGTGIQK